MKMLFITNRFPLPTNRGDRVRTYNIAKILAENNEVTLCAFTDEPVKEEYLIEAQKIFKDIHLVKPNIIKSLLNVIAAIPAKSPLQVAFYKNNEMIEKINTLGEFDLVYTFHLRMAPYGILAKGKYKIMDFTDAVSGFMKNLYLNGPYIYRPVGLIEYGRTSKYEKEVTAQFDECWVVSEAEKEKLYNNGCKDNIKIIPQAVSATYFEYKGSKSKVSEDILFVGYMSVESIDSVFYFLNTIWPAIKKEKPNARFIIAGANPPRNIRSLDNGDDIIVTGFVPDLCELYSNSAVMVAPMRFVVGVQTKIIEAMAMGLPVVSTPDGNGGIQAIDGKEIVIADNPKDFAEQVIELLNNKAKCLEIGKAGRALVEKQFNWSIAKKRLGEINQLMNT